MNNNELLLLYEPYEMTFLKYLEKSKQLTFSCIIMFLMNILKISELLRESGIFIKLALSDYYMISSTIKYKIRPEKVENQEINFFKECGLMGKQILSIVNIEKG